ncbi:MAG: walK 3 [Segetibacter sp.]|nr:walK 3 [Segetibacter sp.]
MPFYRKKPYLGLKFHVLLFPLSIILILTITGCSKNKVNSGSEGDFIELNKLFELASKKADSGNIRGGMQFIDSAVATKKLNVRERFKVLAYKSSVYFYFKDSANTMIYADSMLSLIEKNGKEKYNEEYALANYSKGDVLFFEKKYDEAYKYYFIARHVGKASVDLCTLSEYSYRIGMVLFQQSRFIEAAENFEGAFQQSVNCSLDFSSFIRRQEVLSNTALSFLKAGKLDSAQVYCDKALQYVRKYDGKFKDKEFFNDIAKGVIYENQGEIFKEQGSYSRAAAFFKKNIEINSKKGYDNRNAQLSQLSLAEVYFLNNNIDSMGLLLNQTRQSLDSIENKQAEIDWNRLMWKYNESEHQVAKAFKYLKNYTSLQDSTDKVKSRLNSYNVSQQIKMLEDQYKINSLQKENKLKNLYLFIFFIITTFVIIVFLFSLYILRNTRKNYSVLESLNNQIEEQKDTLKQTLSQLEDRNREKDRILRVVAHDLRAPVASISMLTNLILLETDNNARTEMLKLIKSSSDNSIALISEILEAAGTEIKSTLPKERVDVNEFLAEAVAPLRFKAGEKQQTIQLELSPGNHCFLINKEKMNRVITNLVTNAIKFSETNSTIQVKATNKENAIQIIVHDNGIGIPENLKSKVFDMFTEAKRTGTAGEKPFGLGLSICRQIVEVHDGNIWFESEPGKGTTFYVQIDSK